MYFNFNDKKTGVKDLENSEKNEFQRKRLRDAIQIYTEVFFLSVKVSKILEYAETACVGEDRR